MTDNQQKDLFDFVQQSGNSISDVIDQMLKEGWIDDHGHKVGANIKMLALKDTLERAIEINKLYYNG